MIVECMEPGPALVAKLDQLAEVCDTGTKVVVIGQHNDITLYRELMRRGSASIWSPRCRPCS